MTLLPHQLLSPFFKLTVRSRANLLTRLFSEILIMHYLFCLILVDDLCPYLALILVFLDNLKYLLLLPLLTPYLSDINDPLVIPDFGLPLFHLLHQLFSSFLLYLLLVLSLLPHSEYIINLPPLQLFLRFQEHLLVSQSPDSVLQHLKLVLSLLLLSERFQHHNAFLGK
jgi:hypothetical protein